MGSMISALVEKTEKFNHDPISTELNMFIYAFHECSIKSFYEPIEEDFFHSHRYIIDLRGTISPRKQLDSDHSEFLCLGSELTGPAGTHSILSGSNCDREDHPEPRTQFR